MGFGGVRLGGFVGGVVTKLPPFPYAEFDCFVDGGLGGVMGFW